MTPLKVLHGTKVANKEPLFFKCCRVQTNQATGDFYAHLISHCISISFLNLLKMKSQIVIHEQQCANKSSYYLLLLL